MNCIEVLNDSIFAKLYILISTSSLLIKTKEDFKMNNKKKLFVQLIGF